MPHYIRRDKIERMKSNFLNNFSFKLVALFIALILWLSILNRRDFIVTKEIEVNFITQENMLVIGQSSDRIVVKVSGPQPLLKRYKASNQIVTFDVSDKEEGVHDLEISPNRVEVPKGMKVLSVKPARVSVDLAIKK